MDERNHKATFWLIADHVDKGFGIYISWDYLSIRKDHGRQA